MSLAARLAVVLVARDVAPAARDIEAQTRIAHRILEPEIVEPRKRRVLVPWIEGESVPLEQGLRNAGCGLSDRRGRIGQQIVEVRIPGVDHAVSAVHAVKAVPDPRFPHRPSGGCCLVRRTLDDDRPTRACSDSSRPGSGRRRRAARSLA